jgi:hypothetical protein
MTKRRDAQRRQSQQSDSDFLWGAQAIADYIHAPKRRAQYLIETGRIRVSRIGPKTILGRRSEIDADLKAG